MWSFFLNRWRIHRRHIQIPRKLDIFMSDLHLGNHFLVPLVVGKGRSKLCQILNKIQLSNQVQAQLINPLID